MSMETAGMERREEEGHAPDPERSDGPRGRRWRWIAIGLVGAAGVTAISLVLFRAAVPKALSLQDLLETSDHLHAMAVRPAKDGVRILLGTHNGLYVSADDGKTWKLASERTDFMTFAGSPADKVFYAGGHDIAVLRSLDGGESWKKAGGTLPGSDVHALGADPANPNRAYAWVAGRGLFETSDAGRVWKQVNRRLARVPITSIVVRRDSPKTLLAGTGAGIMLSKDGGASWRPVRNALWGKGVLALFEVEGMPGRFLAGTEEGLYLSTDSAAGFARVEEFLIPGAVIALAQIRGGGSVYALTADGRIFRSRDGGGRWVGLR